MATFKMKPWLDSISLWQSQKPVVTALVLQKPLGLLASIMLGKAHALCASFDVFYVRQRQSKSQKSVKWLAVLFDFV